MNAAVISRTVRADALLAAVTHLVNAGVTFKVDPVPHDLYQVTVKPEAAHLLPHEKDWTEAAHEELIAVARRHYGENFFDPDEHVRLWLGQDGRPTITVRDDNGFTILTETFVPYPEGEA